MAKGTPRRKVKTYPLPHSGSVFLEGTPEEQWTPAFGGTPTVTRRYRIKALHAPGSGVRGRVCPPTVRVPLPDCASVQRLDYDPWTDTAEDVQRRDDVLKAEERR